MSLDEAYNNRDFIPDADSYPPRWAADAAAFREALGARAQLDLAYGPGPRQTADLFLPQAPAKGLMVFVHGGYWRMFSSKDWSHFAAGALALGWAAALPSYTLCPEARIADITAEITHAVIDLAERIDGPIALTGHSAGGHLVARMLEPGRLPPEISERIGHVMPISPVADLRPLLQTSMNTDFKLTEADAVAESPVLQPMPQTKVTVWVGADERPVFIEQARALATAWTCPVEIDPGLHHFNVIDGLKEADSAMMTRLLAA